MMATLKESPGYYIDFQFNYAVEDDDELSEINFSIRVGHELDEAHESYSFVWRNNIENPGIVYIRLRFRPDIINADKPSNIVLSRKTPSGLGDW